MAGTAQLNVVLKIVSKFKDEIPGIKQDAAQVAAAIKDILKTPESAGAGFASLFDFSGKDVAAQIKLIQEAVEVLQVKLADSDIRKSLKIKKSDADEILNSIKQLGADAVRNILPLEDFQKKISEFFDLTRVGQDLQAEGDELKQILKTLNIAGALQPPPGSEKATMAAWGQAIRRRKESAQELVESTKQSESAQTKILLDEIDKRIAAKKAEIEALFHLQSQAISKFEAAQKGGAIRKEAKEEVKALRRQIDEELDLLKNLEDTKEELAKKGADAAIESSKKAGEAERKESKKTADAVVEDAKRVADTKADLKAKTATTTQEATLTTKEQAVADQLLDLWKAYSQQRIKIQETMVDTIVALETAGARKIIDNWEQVAKQIATAIPKGTTRQVVIEFKGKASPVTDLTTTIENIKKKILSIQSTLSSIKGTIHFSETASEIDDAAKAAKLLDVAIKGVDEEIVKVRSDISGLKESFAVRDTLFTSIAEGADRLKAVKVDLEEVEEAAAQKKVAIAKKAAEEVVKVELTAAQKLEAAQQLRINVHRVAADKRLGIERDTFLKIADLYQGQLKTVAEARRNELIAWKADAEEKKNLLRRQLAEQRRLQADAGFNKVRSGTNNYDESIAKATANIAKLSAELGKLDKQMGLADKHIYTIKVLLEASPPVPFSDGIANLKRLLSGLPKESEFKVQVIGLEVEAAKLKKLQDTLLEAENKLIAARERRANAGTDAEKRSANAQIASLTAQVNRHRKAAGEQELATALMFDHINDMAVDAYAKSGKLRKAETDAYVEDEKRKTQAVKEENRKRGDAIADLLAQGRNAQLAARKALDDAISTAQPKANVQAIGASYNIVSAEVKKLAAIQQSANRAMKAGNKEVADQLKGEMVQSLQKVEAEINKLGLDFKQVINSNLNASKMWEDRMTSWSYRFSHVGMQLGMFGAAASAAFLGPIAAVKDFQKTLEYTNSILGGNEASLKKLRDTAMEVGTSTIYSTQQVADGLKTLAQAGLTAEEAMRGVKPILDFASSGMLNLDDAARIAISAMNQFGLGLSDLPRLTNNIQAAANKTNAEVKDFGESLKNVGPTAKAVGASLEETTTALGLLTQAGLKGSAAGTQLRGIYRKLLEASNDGSKAGKIFQELGVSVTDAAGNFKDLQVILEEFKASTADMTEVERAAKVYEIFGQRAGGPAVLALLNAGGEAWANLGKTIAEAADSAQIAKDRGEGLWGALEKLKNSFTGLIQTIGYSEGSFLRGLIDGLTSLINIVRTAIDQSPALRFLINVFMGFTAIAGAITLAGSAMAMLTSNVLSLLGVSGPLHVVWMKLRGTVAATTSQQILSAAAMTSQTGAEVTQTAATNTLSAAWTKLNMIQRAFIAIAIAVAIIEVTQALYNLVKAQQDVNEQIENGTKTYERFKAAAEKPIATKQQFAMMTDAERRAAIKHLSEFERAYIGKIHAIENRIAKIKFWTPKILTQVFGIGDTKALEDELKKAQEELAKAQQAESFITLHPKLAAGAKKKLKQDSLELITELDKLFGNTKLGIDKFDIKKVVDGIQEARDKFTNFEKVISGDKLSEGAKDLEKAFAAAGVTIDNTTASNLQSVREFNAGAQDAILDYYSVAMEATKDFESGSKEANEEMLKDRQNAYDDTVAAIDDMYQQAVTKSSEYAKEIIQIEKDLAKDRVDAYNWYLDQTEVSDKLKSTKRKLREAEEKKEKLFSLFDEQMAAGDTKRAQETAKELMKIQEGINKAAAEDIADAIKKEKKLREDIAKLKDKEAKGEEKAAEKTGKEYDKIAAKERKLADLRDRLTEQNTTTERERIVRQIRELEFQIADAQKYSTNYQSDAADSAKAQRIEKERELAAVENLLASNAELVQKSRAIAAEQEAEEKTIASTAELTGRLNTNASDTLKISNLLVQVDEKRIGIARANLAVWEDQETQALLLRAAVAGIHGDLRNLKLSETANPELLKLQKKFDAAGLVVNFKVDDKDKRSVEVMELATGKVVKTLELPVKVTGASDLDQMIQGVKNLRDTGPVVVRANIDPISKKAIENFKATEVKRVNVELGVDEAKAKSAITTTSKEFVQVLRKRILEDGSEVEEAYWTNFVNEGEKIVNKMSIWKGKDTDKVKEAGEKQGAALIDGVNKGTETKELSLAEKLAKGVEEAKTAVIASTTEMATKTTETQTAAAATVKTEWQTSIEEIGKSWETFWKRQEEWWAKFKAVAEQQKKDLKAINSGGGSTDTPTPATPPGGRFGGLVGVIKGMADGGHIPGYGGGDRHHVLLESGEYVLPKEAVKGIGIKTLNSLRSLFMKGMNLPSHTVGIPRMAAGGPVGAAARASDTMGVYTLNLNLGGSQYPLMGKRDVIDTLIDAMRKEGLTKR